jgi:hypothetical protein
LRSLDTSPLDREELAARDYRPTLELVDQP